MKPAARFERRGFWDIAIEKYMSRKLQIMLAASLILFCGLVGWLEATDSVKFFVNFWDGLAKFYIGAQATVDTVTSYTQYRSQTHVNPTRSARRTAPKDPSVQEEDEMLSA
jgi:hypothetical protein